MRIGRGGYEMRVRGGRYLRVAVVWTLLTFVIAVLVAAQAMSSLYDGQQACFFNYPAVACPTNEDPAIARLTFAFFGVPLIWLVGIGLTTVVWIKVSASMASSAAPRAR